MNITDELERLAKLHQQGALNDQEFALAKDKLLHGSGTDAPPQLDRAFGEAANRYVTLQMVMGAIGIIVFLIVLFAVILPSIHRGPGGFAPPNVIFTPSR